MKYFVQSKTLIVPAENCSQQTTPPSASVLARKYILMSQRGKTLNHVYNVA